MLCLYVIDRFRHVKVKFDSGHGYNPRTQILQVYINQYFF